jgi:DNA repair photolyase
MDRTLRTDFVWVTEMTDPGFYWDKLTPVIESGAPIVIYSKAPIPEKEMNLIKNHTNIAISITITGWGGTWLEPGVKKPGILVTFFNRLIKEMGTERVRLRLDPVIPTEEGFSRALSVSVKIRDEIEVITSLIQIYKDQEKVFSKLGVDMDLYTLKSGRAFYPKPEIAQQWLARLHQANPRFVGRVQFCGMPYDVPGAIHSGCVDEKLLKAIGITNFRRIAAGKQRPGCKCVISKKQVLSGTCEHGCLYCYAHKENLKKVKI